ncbi:MAG TPA: iron-containing alcohol dehydrogenase family protein [Spirochaetota bacterium]|jgi:alcohol dehydrogenase class IV|nr:iron-containing alcohol dehydrogenase [Spirochaetota bacterium]HOQ13150.1 iron-containing alcohol dehydrogenase family protein [Spirochaetota bacterium]HOV09030.1 iron-containing alcohol dehydrogenase family protein [Spirochaetota bacterium]
MIFSFYIPTKVFFGKDCIKTNSNEIAKLGSKALIVTGKSSSDKNGSFAEISSTLKNLNIEYIRFNEVEANPSVETVLKGGELAGEFKADFIIGIGGGSPLDAAKAIAILASNNIDDESLFSGQYKNKPLPLVAVPTTAGTGSEVTPYSILTYKKINNKKSIASPEIFPAIGFLDAKFTETLSMETTINTAIDAMSHSLEGYLSARASEIIKPLALESLKILAIHLKKISEGKKISFEDRENLLYASMLGGMVIAHTATTAVHAMGYPLTYFRNIDHGRANGLVMAAYMEFLHNNGRDLTEILYTMDLKDPGEFKSFMDSLLGQKESLSDSEIELFTDTTMTSKNIANTKPSPSREDIKEIFVKSFH